MDTVVFQELITFLHKQTGVSVRRLMENPAINYDLLIDGDDGDELLEAFALRFRVDMSLCDVSEFFLSEGNACSFPSCLFAPVLVPLMLGVAFFRDIVLKKRHPILNPSTGRPVLPLTVSDLYTAAKERKWPASSSLSSGHSK